MRIKKFLIGSLALVMALATSVMGVISASNVSVNINGTVTYTPPKFWDILPFTSESNGSVDLDGGIARGDGYYYPFKVTMGTYGGYDIDWIVLAATTTTGSSAFDTGNAFDNSTTILCTNQYYSATDVVGKFTIKNKTLSINGASATQLLLISRYALMEHCFNDSGGDYAQGQFFGDEWYAADGSVCSYMNDVAAYNISDTCLAEDIGFKDTTTNMISRVAKTVVPQTSLYQYEEHNTYNNECQFFLLGETSKTSNASATNGTSNTGDSFGINTYFTTDDAKITKSIISQSGVGVNWWLRTGQMEVPVWAFYVGASGEIDAQEVKDTDTYVRPCFVLNLAA